MTMKEQKVTPFFASIRDGDLLAVKKFLDEHPNTAPLFNDEGKSAAKVALEWKKVEVYGTLVERGWWLSKGEDYTELVKEFNSKERAKLREIHKIFFKNPSEKHLTSLITRSSIYFGGDLFNEERRKYLGIIAGVYEELNDIPEICAIFKVVANIELLNVVFDFDRDSIEHADATGNENVNGKCYAEMDGVIYIGAKPLLDDSTRSKALGVLAHELCHYAIFIKYDNDYKPFYKSDEIREEEFWQVYDACKLKPRQEPYIDGVINENARIKLDELIVRVPHLLALYKGDDEKIKSLKEIFPELFNFFDDVTLPELDDEHELMEAVWKLKSKEPQHLTEMKISLQSQTAEFDLTQILEISSNAPQLTLNSIYQEMGRRSKTKISFIILALYNVKDKETFDLAGKSFRSCLKPTIVIDCGNEIRHEITIVSKKMQTAGISERTIFVHNYGEFLIEDSNHQVCKHSWNELERNSKEKLIKQKITFQGQEIILEEITELDSTALNHVPLKPLLDKNFQAGNDLKFPEIDIHITRKFFSQSNNEVEFEELLNIAENEKQVLLSDEAGMGKTTELKTIAMEIKKKLKTFWVSFIDLKEFSEFYEKDGNIKTNFNSSDDIASFFVTKILKLNDFEAGIFRQLFNDGRVVLIMDGFDEISPTFNTFITMLLKAVKEKSDNILVTSTRSHFKEKLNDELGVEAYSLKPFSQKNCDEVLEFYFRKFEVSDEDLKEKLSQTIEFFISLNQNYDELQNPLLLRLIAKVFSDGEFVNDIQPNTFSIYENFITIMIMNSMDKGDEAKKEATTCMTKFNIMQFHQKEAFNEIFRNSNEIMKINIALLFQDVQSPDTEQMQRIGLIRAYSSGKFMFIHRTFAEFFVAQFLFKNAFDLETSNERKQEAPVDRTRNEAINSLMFQVLEQKVFYAIKCFIDGAFGSSIERFEKKNVLSTFCSIIPMRNYFPIFFNGLARDNFINLIEVVTQGAFENDEKLLNMIWTRSVGFNEESVLMTAVRFGSLCFNRKILDLAEKFFDDQSFLNLLTQKDKNGDTAAMLAIKRGELQILKLYSERFNKIFPSGTKQIAGMSFDAYNECLLRAGLMDLVNEKNFSGFKTQLKEIKSKNGSDYLKHLLSSPKMDGFPFYYAACRHLKTIEDFESFWKILRDILGESICRKILLTPHKDGETPLMVKSQKSKAVLMAFWELITKDLSVVEKEMFLLEDNEFGNNLLDYAIHFSDSETFICILELYMETFGKSKMKELLLRERKEGQATLTISVSAKKNNTQDLWDFIQENFDKQTQKEILLDRNLYDETFYMTGLRFPHFDKKYKVFKPFIEENLDENETKLLKSRTLPDEVVKKRILQSDWLKKYYKELCEYK